MSGIVAGRGVESGAFVVGAVGPTPMGIGTGRVTSASSIADRPSGGGGGGFVPGGVSPGESVGGVESGGGVDAGAGDNHGGTGAAWGALVVIGGDVGRGGTRAADPVRKDSPPGLGDGSEAPGPRIHGGATGALGWWSAGRADTGSIDAAAGGDDDGLAAGDGALGGRAGPAAPSFGLALASRACFSTTGSVRRTTSTNPLRSVLSLSSAMTSVRRSVNCGGVR
jgi:hypothetical protein